jgi:hypothetical protein
LDYIPPPPALPLLFPGRTCSALLFFYFVENIRDNKKYITFLVV